MEKDLKLTGITAIEDKLQAGVPATIETLLMAGIKVRHHLLQQAADAASLCFLAMLEARLCTANYCTQQLHNPCLVCWFGTFSLLSYGACELLLTLYQLHQLTCRLWWGRCG